MVFQDTARMQCTEGGREPRAGLADVASASWSLIDRSPSEK